MNYVVSCGGELYHFGTKGMKWGVRKYQNEDGTLTEAGKKRYDVQNAKQNYKNAKSDYNDAKASYVRSSYTSFGYKGLKEHRKTEANMNDARVNMIDKKAELAKAKKGEKAEMKAYARAMSKHGLAGSASDSMSGGKSSKLYDHLAATKGEKYADEVSRKAQNTIVTTAAATFAVTVGAGVVADILSRR